MDDYKPLAYTDPTSMWIQRESGKTHRQLLALARKLGWRTRRIYGRLYICSEDYDTWQLAQETTHP